MLSRSPLLLRSLLLLWVVACGLLAALPDAPGSAATGPRPRETILAYLQTTAARNPSLITVERLGESWRSQRQPPLPTNGIWGIRLGQPVSPSQRSIILVGGQHAREIAGPEVLVRVMDRLLASAGSDPLIMAVLQHATIWVVPLLNPDGYDEVVAGRTDWRKNANDTANQPADALRALPEGIGVDLNRNFPTGWGLPAPPDRGGAGWHGAGTNPADLDYQGPSPGSESETLAIKRLVDRERPAVLITYHSPLASVIWPWGHRLDAPADGPTLTVLGRRLADYYGYAAGQTSREVGFTTGDIADWAYDATGALAFGVELGFGFAPNEQQIEALTEQTYESLRYVLAGLLADEATVWHGPRIAALETAQTTLAGGVRAVVTATVETHLSSEAGPATSVTVAVGDRSAGHPVEMLPAPVGNNAGEAVYVATLDLPNGRHPLWVVARTATGQAGAPASATITALPFRVHAPIALMP